jgi:hypothetical protein
MSIPLAIIRCLFSRLGNYRSDVPTTLARCSQTFLWSLDSASVQEALGSSMKDGWLDEIRVLALFFDYPKHSRATDEGMTHRVLIFGLCGFEPRCKPVEGLIKAH